MVVCKFDLVYIWIVKHSKISLLFLIIQNNYINWYDLM